MDKTLSLSEAKMKLNRLVDNVMEKDDEFIITKNGTPAAVLAPAAVYEGWKEPQAIKADPEMIQEIRKGLENLKRRKRRYSFEEVFGEPLRGESLK